MNTLRNIIRIRGCGAAQVLAPVPAEAVAVSATFTAGFTTTNQAAIDSVLSQSLPKALKGVTDEGEPRVELVDATDTAPAFVRLNADTGYHGTLWIKTCDLDEVLAWLDRVWVDPRDPNWRQRAGEFHFTAHKVRLKTPAPALSLAA